MWATCQHVAHPLFTSNTPNAKVLPFGGKKIGFYSVGAPSKIVLLIIIDGDVTILLYIIKIIRKECF